MYAGYALFHLNFASTGRRTVDDLRPRGAYAYVWVCAKNSPTHYSKVPVSVTFVGYT